MKLEMEKIVCRENKGFEDSKRTKPFWIAKLVFNYQTSPFDKYVLKEIRSLGEELAKSVHPSAANDAKIKRDSTRIECNAIAGFLAEYSWKYFLNGVSIDKLLVKETEYVDAASQIDLETIDDGEKIEIRSSFPRNGIQFAICDKRFEFDVLGPYCNSVKPNEPQKSYYLRTLYWVRSPEDFLEKYYLDDFTVYLTGGASWKMMIDEQIAIEKELLPEDSIDKITAKTIYKVVPFSRSLDTVEIVKLLTNASR